jgi:transcriptional regulator with XRE-family HTH domain
MAAATGIDLTPAQLATLRERREKLSLSLAAVAQYARVSPPAMVRYESGQSRPSMPVLERWADAVGLEAVNLGIQLRRKRLTSRAGSD